MKEGTAPVRTERFTVITGTSNGVQERTRRQRKNIAIFGAPESNAVSTENAMKMTLPCVPKF